MKVNIECNIHPKYKAIEYPRSCCHACQVLYWLKRDGYREMDDQSELRLVRSKKKSRKKP